MKTVLRKFRDEQLGEVSEIEAWVVRWQSTRFTCGLPWASTLAEWQRAFFATKTEANRFARALRDAHKLLRNEGPAMTVKVEKHK